MSTIRNKRSTKAIKTRRKIALYELTAQTSFMNRDRLFDYLVSLIPTREIEWTTNLKKRPSRKKKVPHVPDYR